MSQLLLIPDPRPLDEQLGDRFFRNAPKRAGVYVMRDAAEKVLYVGKAKNLRQRLQNYRIANPDRMPRRHLRMLRQVTRIEFEFCPGESAALKHESKLIRSLKPKFNRAGVWPGKAKFFVWRFVEQKLELAVAETPEPGWQRFGPLGAGAWPLHGTLSRLLWLAMHPARAVSELPVGWGQGRFAGGAVIHCGLSASEVGARLDGLFWASPEDFFNWLELLLPGRAHVFERRVIEAEIEVLKEFVARRKESREERQQLALL